MQKAFSRPWGKNIVTCGNAGRQNSRQSAKFPDRPAQGMVVPAGSRGRDEDRVSASCRNVFFLWGNWRRRRDSNPRYRFRYTPLAGERLRPLGHLSARGFTMRQSLRLQGLFVLRPHFDGRIATWKEAGRRCWPRGGGLRYGSGREWHYFAPSRPWISDLIYIVVPEDRPGGRKSWRVIPRIEARKRVSGPPARDAAASLRGQPRGGKGPSAPPKSALCPRFASSVAWSAPERHRLSARFIRPFVKDP